MIKKLSAAAAVLLITALLILTGCNGQISETDYNRVVSERDAALTQTTSLQNQVASLQAQIDAFETDNTSANGGNVEALETELEELKLEKAALETELGELKLQVFNLESEIKTVNENIAWDFVKNEATYVFDGMEETLVLANTEYSADDAAWVFTFTFDSRQAGYGDREDQMMAQVITPHEVILKLQMGNVVSAVMDGQWNMVQQRMVYAIEEVTWIMTAYTTENTTNQAIEDVDVTLMLNSTTGYLGGNAGCNSYGGPYDISADNLTITAPIIQTMMLCDDEATNEQESEYLQALQGAESWVIENDTLTITGGNMTIEFVKQQ